MARHSFNSRKGQVAVEHIVVLGAIVLGMFSLLQTTGEAIENQLEETAEYVASPGEYYRGFGNNGVGNGEDPQPPGDPPVNDGPGTGPGNPGNRGGTF